MTATSPIQLGRSQTGHTLRRDLSGHHALQHETWLCETMAVRVRYAPVQTTLIRTAIFATGAATLRKPSSARPYHAPRQRRSVVTPADRSGNTVSAPIQRRVTAGKIVYRTGGAA